MAEIVAICERNNWKFIGGIEPDESEDISEVEYLLNPKAFSKKPKDEKFDQFNDSKIKTRYW